MADLHTHEAGNGGQGQGRPTVHAVLFYSETCAIAWFQPLTSGLPVMRPNGSHLYQGLKALGNLNTVAAPAKTAKKLRVALQNPGLRRSVHTERPFVLFKRSSEQDAIRTWKHIEVILHASHVVHFSLRKEHSQLSFYGT